MMRTRWDWDPQELKCPNLDFRSTFQFGRTSQATCDWNLHLPNPEFSCDAVEENFIKNLGLNWNESAALMGVHTLGRASKANSGYEGWWNEGPAGRAFNNSYYVAMLA